MPCAFEKMRHRRRPTAVTHQCIVPKRVECDQNDPNPTPGGQHAGDPSTPGDSDETKVAQSQDSPGEEERAPTDEAKAEQRPDPAPTPASAGQPGAKHDSPARTADADDAKGARDGSDSAKQASTLPGQQAQSAHEATEAVPGMPETVNSPGGTFDVPEAREAKKATRARAAKKKRLPPPRRKRAFWDDFGLGVAAATPGGINPNLDYASALSAVGVDKLAQARRVDGERRRSKHRGSWKVAGIQKWRSAIENYVSTVKPGNQTALNTARVPFASYLNQIHNRLHPIFADAFLASLDGLPKAHPMNQRDDMATNVEIVLSREDGRIVKMGVTQTSGVTAFDIAALEAVQRAQPFGAPPDVIVSPDGNVYLHWEFHRNPYYACSTYFARPFLLKAKPGTAPTRIKPPSTPPFGPREQQVPGEERQGSLRLAPRG